MNTSGPQMCTIAGLGLGAISHTLFRQRTLQLISNGVMDGVSVVSKKLPRRDSEPPGSELIRHLPTAPMIWELHKQVKKDPLYSMQRFRYGHTSFTIKGKQVQDVSISSSFKTYHVNGGRPGIHAEIMRRLEVRPGEFHVPSEFEVRCADNLEECT
jgi:hypothetical protein